MRSRITHFTQAIGIPSFATSTSSTKEMFQMSLSTIRSRYPQVIGSILVIALFAMYGFALSSNASAKRYSGACGGGTTQKDVIAGAKDHGVLDDIANKTGQKVTTDGSAAKIVKDNLVRVIVTKATWITNYTCSNSKYSKLDKKKFLPAGTVLWVPAKSAPANGKTGNVSWAVQENCGNAASGKIPVKRPGHAPSKPKTKSKDKSKTNVQVQNQAPSTPSVSNCVGEIKTIGSQVICQLQSQSQDNKTDQSGTTQGPQSPVYNNNINVQVENQNQNGNENNTGGNSQNQGQSQEQQQAQACSAAGGHWNTQTIHCDMPAPPPSGCTSNCTPQTPGPLVDIVGAAHETFVNGHVALFIKTLAAPNHHATLDFQVTGGGVVSNKAPSNSYDNSPCPSGWECYIARYDAPNYTVEDPNKVVITAIATQDDQQKATNKTELYVIPDDFGGNRAALVAALAGV